MNWGKAIILSFVLFGAFVAGMVTVCIRQDINLVTRDYYKEELAYQEQLDRKQNALDLEIQPEILIRENHLEVHYPEFGSVSSGTVMLFRPSDASLDHEFQLTPASGPVQRFELQSLAKGLYKARMQWVMDGREYYIEKVIVL
ncbi:MAG: FixH family protein [Bacteroidota bacterium]|jgi:hypothetical protein|nr:MAG: nitrogen fixation protein FixH [Bacteroidota bacterium]